LRGIVWSMLRNLSRRITRCNPNRPSRSDKSLVENDEMVPKAVPIVLAGSITSDRQLHHCNAQFVRIWCACLLRQTETGSNSSDTTKSTLAQTEPSTHDSSTKCPMVRITVDRAVSAPRKRHQDCPARETPWRRGSRSWRCRYGAA